MLTRSAEIRLVFNYAPKSQINLLVLQQVPLESDHFLMWAADEP